ncbi:hypothetical protein Bbelb_116390 [Branchiostoma belcheri]|nr:hypothetical protein Bbelb_116390 [Branchiostoma belcheri]
MARHPISLVLVWVLEDPTLPPRHNGAQSTTQGQEQTRDGRRRFITTFQENYNGGQTHVRTKDDWQAEEILVSPGHHPQRNSINHTLQYFQLSLVDDLQMQQ